MKETGSEMEGVFDGPPERRLTDKDNYLLSWLTASPEKLRTGGIDPEARVEKVLSVLQRERRKNVIPFKKLTRLKK